MPRSASINDASRGSQYFLDSSRQSPALAGSGQGLLFGFGCGAAFQHALGFVGHFGPGVAGDQKPLTDIGECRNIGFAFGLPSFIRYG